MRFCLALCLLTGACAVDLAVPPGSEITCVNGTCPEGMICRAAIGLCVPAAAQSDTAPGIVAESVTLSRTAIGVQVPLEVTFEVTEDLLIDPIVVLGTAPPVPLVRTAVTGHRYTYRLLLAAPTAESAASIGCALIGLAGTQAEGLTLGEPVTLDFQPPVIAVFVPPREPLGAGATGTVILTITDALAAPPRVVANDGSELAMDLTYAPPLYGFDYAVPPTATDGRITVTVTLTDSAENVFVSGALDAFDVDVTPPMVVGTPQVIRDTARAGQLVGVSVGMSEPLAGPTMVAMTGPARVALPESNVSATEYTFSRALPAGVVDGVYLVDIESFADRAGNPGVATSIGAITVDATAPAFVVNPDVQPRTVSATAGFDLATVTFSLSEDIGTDAVAVSVRAGAQEPSCTVNANGPNRFDYSCGLVSFAGSAEGAVPVTVLVTDAAGNSAFRAGPPLLVDLTAPQLVGTPQLIRSDLFSRATLGPNDVLLSATSPTQGGVPFVTATFVVSEQTPSAPVIRLNGDLLTTPELVPGASIGQLVVYELHPDASRADGAYSVIAELSDAAGNAATLTVGTLRIDRTPPSLPQATVDAMRYVRAPWGSVSETSRISMTAALEADATLLAVSDASLSFAPVLATRDIPSSGLATDLPLASSVYPRVWLALRDRAGNLHGSQGVAVRNGLWVASFGGKQPGNLDSNPHTFSATATAWATQEPWAQRTTELFDYASVRSVGNGSGNAYINPADGGLVYGGGPNPLPAVRPPARLLAAMAFDPISKTDVLFGGVSRSSGSALSDVWLFDGNAWKPGIGGPPSAIQSAMATLDGTPFLGGVALFGGSGASSNSATCALWRWTGSAWVQRTGDACSTGQSGYPTSRTRHAMTFVPSRRWLVMSGGTCQTGPTTSGPCGDIWVNRPTSGDTAAEWRTNLITTPSAPATARSDHGMAYDEARDVLVLYGGITGSGTTNGDIWEYSFASASWRLVSMTTGWPQPRSGMLFGYDTERRAIVMAGGKSGTTMYSDAYVWNGTTWTLMDDPYCSAPLTPACLRDFVIAMADGASTYDRARHLFFHMAPDTAPNGQPPQEFLSYAGFAPSYHPAGLATFDLTQAQLQTAWVNRIDLVALGGGVGNDTDGDPMAGAIAELWVGDASGQWSAVAANSADITAVAALNGALTGALARSAIEGNKVRARIITDWPAGPNGAQVAVDLIELKVAYTIP